MERYQMHEFLASVSGAFSISAFDSLGLPKMIAEALEETNSREKRSCPLRASLIMSLVLAMNLMRTLSIYDVFQTFISSLRSRRKHLGLRVVTEEAIYHSRGRLGAAPVKALFSKTALMIEQSAWFYGRRTWAADGVSFLVTDTKANAAAFGKPNVGNGDAAFPQVKGMALVATETREIRAIKFGPHYMSEQSCLAAFVDLLGPKDLLLVDRGLPSFELFEKCKARSVELLARISGSWRPRILRKLGKGDHLVEIRKHVVPPEDEPRRKGVTRCWAYLTVRMIKYTFKSTGEIICLLTNILDPKDVSAIELAKLYHERWECEIAYDELKTHLESTPQGTVSTVFRSQTPEGVIQEAYGMVAVYNLVRHLMARAARRAKIDPDQISFVGSLNVIKLAIPRIAAAPEKAKRWLHRQLLDDIAACKLPNPRRKRVCPRCVRQKFVRFPRKRAEFKERYFDYNVEITLVDKNNARVKKG